MYLNINQDQDRALPGGEQRFPLCCSVQGQVALQPWRPHLGGSSVSFQSPHLSAYATPPIYTVPSWRARGRRLQGALCKGHDPTSRSSDGSPLSRVAGWPDHTASPPHPHPLREQGLCQDLPACSACSSNANPLGRAAGASRPFMHTSQGLAPLHGGSIVENRLHAESTARRSARLASAAGSV